MSQEARIEILHRARPSSTFSPPPAYTIELYDTTVKADSMARPIPSSTNDHGIAMAEVGHALILFLPSSFSFFLPLFLTMWLIIPKKQVNMGGGCIRFFVVLKWNVFLLWNKWHIFYWNGIHNLLEKPRINIILCRREELLSLHSISELFYSK